MLHISDRIDIATVTNAESFKSLETSTQEIITSIFTGGREINASIVANTTTLASIRADSESQHMEIVKTLAETAQTSDGHTTKEHVKTREELVRMQ
jgi:hypothetical protein